jgi:hypothetical protein
MIHRKEPPTFAKRGNKACRIKVGHQISMPSSDSNQPNVVGTNAVIGFREQENPIKIAPWIILKTMRVRMRTSMSTTPTAATTPVTTHCCWKHRERVECSDNGGRPVEAAVESHLLAGTVGLVTSFKGHKFGYCSRLDGFEKEAVKHVGLAALFCMYGWRQLHANAHTDYPGLALESMFFKVFCFIHFLIII